MTNAELAYPDELIGRRVGMLTVISQAPRPPNRKMKGSYYLCQCDCGNTTITSRKQLVGNRIKSCGCLKKIGATAKPERRGSQRKYNLIGCRFGMLTVIDIAPSRDDIRTFWLCKCECGNVIAVSHEALRKGKVDCGCLTPEKRTELKKIQRKNRRNETIRKYQEA